jgi:hypothetical protein
MEFQNVFHTKTNIIATIVPKAPKPNNVPVNVIATITTPSQLPKQKVLRKHEQ